MKKLFTTLVILGTSFGAFAQFNQGRILAGGSFAFETSTEKEKAGSTTATVGKTTSFSLAPNAGYFIIDNVAVGAELNLTLSGFKPDNEDFGSDVNTTMIMLSPFVRYYLEQGIFFQGQFGIGSGKTKVTEGSVSEEAKYGLSGWALSAGYAIFLNDNVAIEPQLGYGSMGRKLKDSDPESKNIDSGLFLRVGFQIYLGNK